MAAKSKSAESSTKAAPPAEAAEARPDPVPARGADAPTVGTAAEQAEAAAHAPPGPVTSAPAERPHTLCIDVGGTGVKAIVLDAKGQPLCERLRVTTPRPANPQAVLAVIQALASSVPPFDRVSVGFPGVVKQSIVHTAPNLDEGWAKFPLGAEIEKLTSKPTRVLNDAGVQGYGAITGKGTEMILTLGTGMGCAIFINGAYVPNVELAHHPFKKKWTYEDYVRNDALKTIGKKRWNKRVRKVVSVVLPIFNPDVLYLGGGNARLLKQDDLPPQVKVVENIAGLLGGIALWKFQGLRPSPP